jgi:hypothetical protein
VLDVAELRVGVQVASPGHHVGGVPLKPRVQPHRAAARGQVHDGLDTAVEQLVGRHIERPVGI